MLCLTIATVSKRVSTIKRLQGKCITYYILPLKSYETCWLSVRDDVKPDVIHLHGTEYPWGKSDVDTCGPEHVVVSIQGLLSIEIANQRHNPIKNATYLEKIYKEIATK